MSPRLNSAAAKPFCSCHLKPSPRFIIVLSAAATGAGEIAQDNLRLGLSGFGGRTQPAQRFIEIRGDPDAMGKQRIER